MAKSTTSLLLRMDAQHRLIAALIISATVLAFIFNRFTIPGVILITWVTFAMMVIVLDWFSILKTHPREVRKLAKMQDSSRAMIFLFVILASIVSMVAVIFLLKSSKGHADSHIVLAMSAVVISWWLVHTIFTMRYAHLYYDIDTDDGGVKKEGGLDFPGNEIDPDYMDFVYFSFVLGMTFQVSDVEISSREIRRLAWLHGLISFAFNTAIVALSINVISGLVAA